MEVDDIQTHQACKFSRVANGSKLDSSKLIHNHQHHHHLYPHDDDSHHNHQPHRTSTGITANNNNINTHINGLASAAEMGSAAAAGAPDETGGNGGGNSNRLRHLQHSNRIIRVSRASGGKDRHSKVWTAKGARDRRVRLSVTTAIQFYDLQDRLGFDQPSKAVEWLIKAAADAIAELPSLNGQFGTTDHHHLPGHGSALAAVLVTDVNDRRQLTADNSNNDNIGRAVCIDSADAELDDDEDETHNFRPHHHQGSLRSKSACSSTSETSKGSGLSLSRSRSEKRVQARERARERAAKDKEKENEPRVVNNVNVNVNPLSHGGSSFTQLLTAGIGMGNVDTTAAVTCSSPAAAAHHGSNGRQWPITSSAPMAMEYFNMLAMASSSSSSSSRGGGGGGGGGSVNNNNNNGSNNSNNGNPNHSSPGFPGQIQLGNSMSQTMMVSPFTVAAGDHHHSELHQFPFVPDHLVQNTAAATGNDYNLNFSISPSGLAGFNRGTLQSNSSPSLYPQLQRFPALDGTSLPFFLGAAAAAPSAENQHHHHNHQHHQQQFPPGLQLCYRDGGRQQSDQKGKGKN